MFPKKCVGFQTTLLGEAGGAGATGSGGGEALRSRFESKLNIASRDGGGGGGGGGPQSQSVRNDIKRSEKSGEKTSRHTGRDDRATVEQVKSGQDFFYFRKIGFVFFVVSVAVEVLGDAHCIG